MKLLPAGLLAPVSVQSAPDASIGITCATLAPHMHPRNPDGFRLLDLPRIARDELDMRVLDLATTNLEGLKPDDLEAVRSAAADAGCNLTNLKMNQPGLDLGSRDNGKRDRSLSSYRKSIDDAARLGMQWARPLPTKNPPENDTLFLDGMRQLAEYADEKGLTLLIENYGWMERSSRSIVELVEAIDAPVAASPDTGNWVSNEIRYEGLSLSFPIAVTCDFKVKTLGPDLSHAAYDLERCFRMGAAARFRGPWCIEHGHRDRTTLFRELSWIRDQMREWDRT